MCSESKPFIVNIILSKTGYLTVKTIHFKVILDNEDYKAIEGLKY